MPYVSCTTSLRYRSIRSPYIRRTSDVFPSYIAFVGFALHLPLAATFPSPYVRRGGPSVNSSHRPSKPNPSIWVDGHFQRGTVPVHRDRSLAPLIKLDGCSETRTLANVAEISGSVAECWLVGLCVMSEHARETMLVTPNVSWMWHFLRLIEPFCGASAWWTRPSGVLRSHARRSNGLHDAARDRVQVLDAVEPVHTVLVVGL